MPRKKKSREISVLGIVVLLGIAFALTTLTNALHSFWLGLLVVLAPVVLLGVYAWKVPEHRPIIFSGFRFLKTQGLDLMTEQAIEAERKARANIPAAVRRKVIERDKKCRYPDCTTSGITPHIHHIDQDPSNSSDPDNLIFLCPNHHVQIHDRNKLPLPDAHIKQLRAWTKGNYRTEYQRPGVWGRFK